MTTDHKELEKWAIRIYDATGPSSDPQGVLDRIIDVIREIQQETWRRAFATAALAAVEHLDTARTSLLMHHMKKISEGPKQ